MLGYIKNYTGNYTTSMWEIGSILVFHSGIPVSTNNTFWIWSNFPDPVTKTFYFHEYEQVVYMLGYFKAILTWKLRISVVLFV